jgi:glycosyltransferase involved in cell wall biosynthesis
LLLFTKFDVAHANDLDTLLPNYLATKIKRKQIVYDTHEYFTEVPELQQNRFKKNIWLFVEKLIFPKLKYVFTVNQSIADVYKNLYGVDVKVLRNVPPQKTNIIAVDLPIELQQKRYLILQGAGINIDRGAEELVKAMNFVNDANLLIVGDGDVLPNLKQYVYENNLSSKVIFLSKKPYPELMAFTCKAAIGVTLDKDTNLNYKLSLPNKLFDYVRAEIPILASPLIETKRVFEKYNVGCLIPSHHPQDIANTINYMLSNEAPNDIWKKNVKQLSTVTRWENESETLIEVYKNFKN